MEKYAPKVKDLASRDVISRAMYMEMKEGRGIGGKRYLYLDVRPETVNKYAALDGRKRPDDSAYVVTAEEIISKLPDIADFCRVYLGVDPVEQPRCSPLLIIRWEAFRPINTGRWSWMLKIRFYPGYMLPGRWRACPSTAPTAWAPTRCWI